MPEERLRYLLRSSTSFDYQCPWLLNRIASVIKCSHFAENVKKPLDVSSVVFQCCKFLLAKISPVFLIIHEVISCIGRSTLQLMKMIFLSGARPAKLTALQQATYVLEKLSEGVMPPQIIEEMDDDIQLVEIWMDFLVDMRWIERNTAAGASGYTVTDKGKDWLTKLSVLAEYARSPPQLSNTSS